MNNQKIRIESVFNEFSVECPECGPIDGHPYPIGIDDISTPEEAWKYRFECSKCHNEYTLGQVAMPSCINRFDDWFETIFPGRPKPWKTNTVPPVVDKTNMEEPDLNKRVSRARDSLLGGIFN